MTSLDSVFPGIATELLAEFGVSATLTRVVKSYDNHSGREYESTTPSACKALAPTTTAAARNAGGSGTAMTETYIAGPSLAVPPQAGDKLLISGHSWLVASVASIRSGELTAVYKLEVVAQ